MKLSVSNIAWETVDMIPHLKILKENGCIGMELAPSMIWKEPIDSSKDERKSFRNLINSFGLEICSMHSLTFTRPDLHFFQSKESKFKLNKYITDLSNLAFDLDCPILVFGSPKSRSIRNYDKDMCLEILKESFWEIAQRIKVNGTKILIEPLGYNESDLINTCEEGYKIINEVNHPNFKMHVDLRSTFENKENQSKIWKNHKNQIMHCHVANPGLQPPDKECLEHTFASDQMRKYGYTKFISIEMRRGEFNTQHNLKKSISFVKREYLQCSD